MHQKLMLHNPTYNNLGSKALQFKQQTRGQRQWIRFSNSGTWEHYFPVFMQNRANLISDNKITRHRMSSLYVRSQFTLCKYVLRFIQLKPSLSLHDVQRRHTVQKSEGVMWWA